MAVFEIGESCPRFVGGEDAELAVVEKGNVSVPAVGRYDARHEDLSCFSWWLLAKIRAREGLEVGGRALLSRSILAS
jgi:hypothetical protein